MCQTALIARRAFKFLFCDCNCDYNCALHIQWTDCRAISVFCFVLLYSSSRFTPSPPHPLWHAFYTFSFFVVPLFANRFVAFYRRIYLFE